MLAGRKILLGDEEHPLVVLEKHRFDFKLELDDARAELVDHLLNSGESFTWGYFPGMEDDEKEKYPECIKLGKVLQDSFFDDRLDWELAFIKFANKKPVSPYGGFHVDVDVGAGHRRSDKREIIRALVNLHDSPRIFLYSFADRNQLNRIGIKVPVEKYKRIFLPERFVKKVEISPISDGEIFILKFFASLLPHFGSTDEHGHFLAGFGAYVDEGDSI